MLIKPEIIISQTDYNGLNSLLDRIPESNATELLIDELERAKIVEEDTLSDSVVRMHSVVTFTVNSTKQTFTLKLVYPHEASENDTISILTPVGGALIGLSVGQSIQWPLDNDRSTTVHIDAIQNVAKES